MGSITTPEMTRPLFFPPIQLLLNINSKTLQLIQLCFKLNLAPRPPNRPSNISYPQKTCLLLQLGIIFFHVRVLESSQTSE